MDDQLLSYTRANNDKLKSYLDTMDVQIVITSPQTAALQTCLDIFGSRNDVEIYIEPLLHPRINCTSNIPAKNDDLISKFPK